MTEPAPIDAVIAQIRAVYGKWDRTTPVETMRQEWDDLFRARAATLPLHKVDAGGVPGEWIIASDRPDDRAILFLHGGGFRLGSIDSHRDLVQRLSRAAEARVLAINYRLCPEHRFPAPVEDVLAAYRWMLEQGIPPARIAFAGDSAGAGLTISAMLAARAHGLSLPAAAFLMSAWTDMEATGRSYETHSARDPIHQRPMILAIAKGYLGRAEPRNQLASPIHCDLRDLPPTLLQCGGRETLLDDTVVFAEKARAAGVQVEVEVFDDMIHVFQMFAAELSDARRAIASAGAFIHRHIPSRQIGHASTGQPIAFAASIGSDACRKL